ncbi:hypothetical protein L195_g053925, partial [Trifolium pratense]
MGSWNSDTWTWNLLWTAEFTVTDAVTAADLLALLQQVRPACDSSDRRKWLPNTAGFFTVKSAYMQLQNTYALEEKATRASNTGILFGWQRCGVYGGFVTTFYLE